MGVIHGFRGPAIGRQREPANGHSQLLRTMVLGAVATRICIGEKRSGPSQSAESGPFGRGGRLHRLLDKESRSFGGVPFPSRFPPLLYALYDHRLWFRYRTEDPSDRGIDRPLQAYRRTYWTTTHHMAIRPDILQCHLPIGVSYGNIRKNSCPIGRVHHQMCVQLPRSLSSSRSDIGFLGYRTFSGIRPTHLGTTYLATLQIQWDGSPKLRRAL